MRRALVVIALIVSLGAGVGIGWWSSSRLGEVAPEPVEVPEVLTVTVREDILDDAVLVEAGYDYAPAGTLRAQGVLTAASPTGTLIDEGDAPFEVELAPQFVLEGERPMFRDLAADDRGADVTQLHAALDRLGYAVDAASDRVSRQTLTAWAAFLADRGQPATENIASIPASQVTFVPDLPVRVAEVQVAVGDLVAGPIARLEAVTPRVYAVLPSHVPYERAENGGVVLISPVDQSWTEAPVVDRSTREDGSTLLILDVQIPEDWLGLPLRGRIGGPSEAQPGLVLPLAAISTSADGSTSVTVLDGDDSRREVPVDVVSTSRTEALVTGSLQAGDEVVLGP